MFPCNNTFPTIFSAEVETAHVTLFYSIGSILVHSSASNTTYGYVLITFVFFFTNYLINNNQL